MKTSRLLLVIAALVVAAIGYWWIRDRAPSNPAVPMLEGVPAATDAPRAPARETIESPSAAATEPDSAAVAIDSGRTHADVPQLEVLLLDSEGRPVVDARIALFRELELLVQGVTDSKGLVSWPPQSGEAEYAIAALGWEIVRGKIELSAGRKTITLVEGATIAGVALVDGAAAQPFELQWRSDAYAGQVALPLPVARALRRPQAKHLVTATLTEADGSFQFRGLRAEAKGKLQWTAAYFLRGVENEGSARGLRVDAPRSDLVLDLVAGIELRLRVVDPLGTPLPGAGVKVQRVVKLASGAERSWETANATADSEGRYRQALSPQESDQCTVSVSAPNTSARKAHLLTRPPGLRGVWDVGDLATFEVRTLLVRVQDAQGDPVEGAIVYPWPIGSERQESKTNPEGRVTMVISETLAAIAVEAFTYTSNVIEFGTDAAEVTVTLQRSCTLEFELSDPTSDREGLSLELSAVNMLVAGTRVNADSSMTQWPSTSHTEGGSSSSRDSDGRQVIIVEPYKDARWRVTGLLPHQPLRARLSGNGTLVCELDIAPLAPGEQRKVTLDLPAGLRTLVVCVVSPERMPVPGAMVSTETGDATMRRRTGRKVDAKGEMKIAWLLGERFDCIVTADGFPPKRVSVSPIPQGRLEVVFDPPNSLEIELVQPDGTPFLGRTSFSAEIHGTRRLEPVRISDGVYRVDAMPAGDVLLHIQGDFGTVNRFHRVGDPPLRIVVGAPGSIEVTVSGKAADDHGWMLEAAMPGASQGFARAGLDGPITELPRATFRYMPPGEYDIWLMREESFFSTTYVRQGAPARAVLDASHTSAKLDMEIPQ